MDEPEIAPPTSSPTDQQSAPCSVEEGFVAVMSTPEVAPILAPVKRWKVIVAFVAAVLALLASIAFFLDATRRLREDRSMDVPFPGNRRVGFFGMDGFKDWVCNEGHEHLSAPYWTGALLAVAITTLLAFVFFRLARRPRG